MSYYGKVQASPAIKDERGWNVHSHVMRVLLGLPDKSKLPKDGMPPRLIQGVKVWVEPSPPERVRENVYGERYKVKSSAHRVMAECPRCGACMSAGRLHQHVCKEQKSD